MDAQKSREPRRIVLVTGRMRHDSGWTDLTICNLSAHGLMAKCAKPPPRGTFVEVRRGTVCIVGQVRWAYAGRLGIRTQERIDIAGLLGDAPAASGQGADDRRQVQRSRSPGGEGRSSPSGALEERSRRWARRFDWLVVATVGIVSAGLLVAQVHSTLSRPLAQARAALAG
jgi:hypothetical protein